MRLTILLIVLLFLITACADPIQLQRAESQTPQYENHIPGSEQPIEPSQPSIPATPAQPNKNSRQLVCTKDAKLCQDGSFASRDPENNCEFDCPRLESCGVDHQCKSGYD